MSDNEENKLENADEMEENADLDDILDEDDDNDEEDGEDETEDTLDSDKDSSTAPSSKASKDVKQKGPTPDNPVAEDATGHEEEKKEKGGEDEKKAEDDNNDEEDGEDETEDALDSDKDSSTAPSNKASKDAAQKGPTPADPVVEGATEHDAEEQATEEFAEGRLEKRSADATGQPGEKDPPIPNPTTLPERTKVKQVVKEAVDSLMIDLTFETVRKTITLAELKSIKPGYTFISQNPVNSPVEIRANGKLIGYGKLVSVDGNIGIQIMEFV